MKSIILSVQPQWLAKILNGEKTIEIRKSAPKELPCEVYLYCTKKENTALVIPKGETIYGQVVDKTIFVKMPEAYWEHPLGYHGKVVGKFTLEGYGCSSDIDIFDEEMIYTLVEHSCVPFADIIKYANKKPFYVWHIDNLVIFDKPMELGEFQYKPKWAVNEFSNVLETLTRAPQSWQYVEPIK